ESVNCQLNGATESIIPVSPAMRNWKMKAMQKIMGNSKRILPPYMVASQLKILIPVGIPTSIVEIAKKLLAIELIPTANIWSSQTVTVMKPMVTAAATITG